MLFANMPRPATFGVAISQIRPLLPASSVPCCPQQVEMG